MTALEQVIAEDIVDTFSSTYVSADDESFDLVMDTIMNNDEIEEE